MAVTYLLDTSAFSVLTNGTNARLQNWMTGDRQIVLSIITVGELRAGYAIGNRQAMNEAILRRFLDSPNVSIDGITDATTHEFADIFATLRRTGKTVGSNDIWIAATAREHGYEVVTLDSDFERIPGLTLTKF